MRSAACVPARQPLGARFIDRHHGHLHRGRQLIRVSNTRSDWFVFHWNSRLS